MDYLADFLAELIDYEFFDKPNMLVEPDRDKMLERIKNRRTTLHKSQADIAKKLGMSRQAYSKIEKGKTKKLNKKQLKILSIELLCTEDYLLGKAGNLDEPCPKNLVGKKRDPFAETAVDENGNAWIEPVTFSMDSKFYQAVSKIRNDPDSQELFVNIIRALARAKEDKKAKRILEDMIEFIANYQGIS